jgi:hypothetical protein
VFACAGLLTIGSGLYFRIPFPVQPLKALTAVAVAQQLSPGVIGAAGLEIAAFLLLLSVGRVADHIASIFTRPIVRALQLGVGALLVSTAFRLATRPPEVFKATPPAPWPLVLFAVALFTVWWAARTQRYALALVMLVAGAGAVWIAAAPAISAPHPSLPAIDLPAAGDYRAALLLLVVPQLPLTFGNAVVAVSDVARTGFGEAASRVTPSHVCLSCATGNIVSAVFGGIPMCHGAGGLTAHIRLGARTRWMNVGLGTAFVVLGIAFGDQVPALLGVLPAWVLAAFLAYAGIRHALLSTDLRGAELAVAIVAGGIGAWRGNLAVTVAIGLLFTGVSRIGNRRSTYQAAPVTNAK